MLKNPIVILLVQLIGYIAIFLWDEHVAYLLSIIIGAVVLAILIIAYLVEKVEPSKVSSSYFITMWMLLLAPVLVILFFQMLKMLP